MNDISELVNSLQSCPLGAAGWRQFEDVCIETLTFLFVPPLTTPLVQARTLHGVERRDAIFPNRNDVGEDSWSRLRRELNARMIVFEFKNYDDSEIGADEVLQLNNYIRTHFGHLGCLVCSKTPNDSARIRRNTIFSEQRHVILFVTKNDLIEMLIMKERGEDPADLIMDAVELFYVQHE